MVQLACLSGTRDLLSTEAPASERQLRSFEINRQCMITASDFSWLSSRMGTREAIAVAMCAAADYQSHLRHRAIGVARPRKQLPWPRPRPQRPRPLLPSPYQKNLLRLRGCHRLAERRVTQRLHPPFGPFGLKKARRRAHHVADHQAIYTTFKSRKSS